MTDPANAARIAELMKRRGTLDRMIGEAEAVWLSASEAFEAAEQAQGLTQIQQAGA